MADIKQAAKWMRKGKPVRRRVWRTSGSRIAEPRYMTIQLIWENGLQTVQESFLCATSDFLADDWEVVEEGQ